MPIPSVLTISNSRVINLSNGAGSSATVQFGGLIGQTVAFNLMLSDSVFHGAIGAVYVGGIVA